MENESIENITVTEMIDKLKQYPETQKFTFVKGDCEGEWALLHIENTEDANQILIILEKKNER